MLGAALQQREPGVQMRMDPAACEVILHKQLDLGLALSLPADSGGDGADAHTCLCCGWADVSRAGELRSTTLSTALTCGCRFINQCVGKNGPSEHMLFEEVWESVDQQVVFSR